MSRKDRLNVTYPYTNCEVLITTSLAIVFPLLLPDGHEPSVGTEGFGIKSIEESPLG